MAPAAGAEVRDFVRDDNPITAQVPSIAGLVRPAEATFSAHDRDVLAAYWHPVAYASEVADRPLSRRLLDVRLVVFRGEHGVCVARDLCAHRGSSLSRGRMDGCSGKALFSPAAS